MNRFSFWQLLFVFLKRGFLFYWIFFTAVILLIFGCNAPQKESLHKRVDYIRKIYGENDSIPVTIAKRGEVLIAYADCSDCHSIQQRAKGPAFEQIAEKYPVKKTYINMLAQRIILGGYGTWGQPVMAPHPNLSHEDAATMVKYILSLKKL